MTRRPVLPGASELFRRTDTPPVEADVTELPSLSTTASSPALRGGAARKDDVQVDDEARRAEIPVVYTTVSYSEGDKRTAAAFIDKIPALLTLEAGSRYVETRDSTALDAFRRYGAQAHLVQREMNARLSQTPDNARADETRAADDQDSHTFRDAPLTEIGLKSGDYLALNRRPSHFYATVPGGCGRCVEARRAWRA